jgi:hypothetical protein
MFATRSYALRSNPAIHVEFLHFDRVEEFSSVDWSGFDAYPTRRTSFSTFFFLLDMLGALVPTSFAMLPEFRRLKIEPSSI